MRVSNRLASLRPGVLKFSRTTAAIATIAIVAVFGSIGYNYGPAFYWYMLSAIVPALVYGVLRRAVPLANARVRARKRWMSHGPTVERVPYTQFEVFRANYLETTRNARHGYVDDRTWRDLGMDEIHDRVDVCFTIAGRNELARILRHALPPSQLRDERVELEERLRTDDDARTRVAQSLSAIGEERDADPASVLWNDVRRDSLFPMFVSMAGFAVVSIVLTAAVDVTLGVIAMLVVFVTNLWIYYRKARHISIDIPALRVLSRMVSARDIPGVDELRREVSGAERAFRWLLTGAPSPSPTMSGDITEAVLLYVKIFFQIDLIAYNRIISLIDRKRDRFQALYQTIGSIDAVYALASYRARRKRTCAATICAAGSGSPDGELAAETPLVLDGAYHPLVPKAVPNSVTIGRPGAIITGTNMAGKSTFLRTVGINVLFAQAAGYAFALEYRAPRLAVMSSIEKHDDLSSGKSFYFDEAERIYRMIEEVGTDTPMLLLIDELLSGTNSLERESASIAILHYLAERNAVTLAATHDVAIAHGVSDRYALHYFTDQADASGLTFDYRIHEGVVETRNAIELLRLIGYPEDVITTALERTK
ncbi:MAG: hypothetical protein EA382_13745 [Spirochaetaceae bacterium]|nr:MAG: hypothetical protein EA382_13745 [Spirochaetaceae bacterium]